VSRVYRARPAWWRTRAVGLIVTVLGYLLLIVALCAAAGLVLR
jgi:hypothetical protein